MRCIGSRCPQTIACKRSIRRARYQVLADGLHRYDAYVVDEWLPLIVFAVGDACVLAWWADQDDGADELADGDAIYAAFEAVTST